jgi:TatD DNase family protein
MNLPSEKDYIDIHNHGGGIPPEGIFTVENLIAAEERIPDFRARNAYSIGIHPWHLENADYSSQLKTVEKYAGHENIIALGEAGFDRLRGPSVDLQKKVFEEQAVLAARYSKPLFIHCVRAWEELISSHKAVKPVKPWIIHGFRGKPELAKQLVIRGMYISFWFEFIVRTEASVLVRSLPADRIFLETDGSGADIREIYRKVASDLHISENELVRQIYSNFMRVFS